jgi:hypothetical protein
MSFHVAIEKASSKEKIFISERHKTGNSVLGNAFGRNFPFRHQAAGFGVEMRARHFGWRAPGTDRDLARCEKRQLIW